MVHVDEQGETVFRVYLPCAERVRLVGDFTGWLAGPLAMAPEDGGWWSARVALDPGEHTFLYQADGLWHTDYAAFGVEVDDYGNWVSRVYVPEVDALVAA